MNVEYANIFVGSAVRIFEQEMGSKLTRKSLTLKNAPVPGLPVSIIIGVTGFLTGQVVYSMDEDFAFKVTRALMPNRLPAEARKYMSSAVAEVANIITGQATISLAGEHETIHLTPPAVLTGKDMLVDFLTLPTICLSLISEFGILEINIAIDDKQAG